jgi:hypothetical protein
VTRTWDTETKHDHVIYGRIAVGLGLPRSARVRLQPEVGLVYPFDLDLGFGFAGRALAASGASSESSGAPSLARDGYSQMRTG